jgi:methanogenic corrinoid protein MtbC1
MSADIIQAFLAMQKQPVMDLIQNKLQGGENSLDVLIACQKGMEEVGKRFETGEFFLSELIYAAEVFKGVTALLGPKLSGTSGGVTAGGAVVFGTPQGDIHDLGKNIVITVMQASGFKVYDLGVDVPPQKFIQTLQETGASLLAMSALITTAFKPMKEVVNLLGTRRMRDQVFVLIGGAVTTDLVRREVGADAQTLDPYEGIRKCREFLKRKKENRL